MSWFTFSLLSVIALATAELMQQHLLNDDNDVDEQISLVLTFTIQSIMAIPIIFFSGLGSKLFSVFEFPSILFLLASTLAASLAMIFYLKSFRVKNISISAMFISFSAVVSTILGIVFLSESFTPLKFIGLIFILGAIISLNYKNEALEKNHVFGLVAGVFFGITYLFDKLVVTDVHPLIYLFWSFLFVTFFAFIKNPKYVISATTKISKITYRNMFISGFGYFIYNLSTFTAYTKGGEIGRVDAINNAQIFLIILFEYFILRQRGQFSRKIITALCAFAGIYILGNF